MTPTYTRSVQIAALHDRCANTARELLMKGAAATLSCGHYAARDRIARSLRLLQVAQKCARRLGFDVDGSGR